MAEEFGFFDPVEIAPDVWDREYNAEEFTDYFGSLITTGVMRGAGAELKVTANGSNMITEIDTGVAFVEGKRYANTAKLAPTHDTETLGKDRVDRIVVRMDLNERWVKSFVKKGVATASPVPPSLTRTANVYEISLAQVRIVGGQTYISAGNVTDERGNPDVCPWAGSKILPNFNDEALEQLINSQLVDGPYAKTYTGDLNDLVVSGFYSVPSGTPNGVSNVLKGLVEVIVSDDGNFVLQKYRSEQNHLVEGIYIRTGAKNAEGIWEWARANPGQGAIVNGWRLDTMQLSDSINSHLTNTAATSSAVKQLNDKMNDSGYITIPTQGQFALGIPDWPLRIRRFGPVASVEGFIRITAPLTGNSIATLPTGFDSRSWSPFVIIRNRGAASTTLTGVVNGRSLTLLSEHMSQVTTGDYLYINTNYMMHNVP